jgi:hypothetical protein
LGWCIEYVLNRRSCVLTLGIVGGGEVQTPPPPERSVTLKSRMFALSRAPLLKPKSNLSPVWRVILSNPSPKPSTWVDVPRRKGRRWMVGLTTESRLGLTLRWIGSSGQQAFPRLNKPVSNSQASMSCKTPSATSKKNKSGKGN